MSSYDGFHDSSRAAAEKPAHIGVGVIGHGFMGKVHSNAYLKIPFSYPDPPAYPDLVAVCGRNETAVRDTALRLKSGGYYTDWKKLIADPRINLVDVCTPDDRHEAPSIAAAEAGKHVICEKPLAMTVPAAKAMRDAAVKAGVKHMLCHNYRFFPAVRLARQLLDAGALGSLYQFRGRYLQDAGHNPETPLEGAWYAAGTKSGVLLGIGSHIIDMARFLIGEIVSLSGIVKTYNGTRTSGSGAVEQVKADEENMALVEFENGTIGTIESSCVSTGRKNQLAWEINGSKGSMSFDLEDPNHLQVYLDDSVLKEVQGFANVSVTGGRHPLQTLILPPGHNCGWEYGHIHALAHFIDCIVNGKEVAPFGATFEDGYRIQVIMEAFHTSYSSGKRIKLT
ncbi:MAG: Gfo/Idh/MocA family oxidoreductase, partial [Spirochaetales bacterium]